MTMVGITSYILRLGGDMLRSPVPAPTVRILGMSLFDIFGIVSTILVWYFLFRTGPKPKTQVCWENGWQLTQRVSMFLRHVHSYDYSLHVFFPGGMALSLSWCMYSQIT